MKTPVKGSTETFAVLGHYIGEALDTNITNRNGLDITAEVLEKVFDSDDYKQGIENGWFIGFLGHPEDPNCMDFEKGCIVMTEGHLDSHNKVQATFNLIDTPVGRVVKTFIDTGVKFGISIRGAGDINDNSVDPDTFVFRGFDLVSFPAFPESIPTFTPITASTSSEKQRKYQTVSAAVTEALSTITSSSALDEMGKLFSKRTPESKAIKARKEELKQEPGTEDVDITPERLQAMTEMYLQSVQACAELSKQLEAAKKETANIISASDRKMKSLERITADQVDTLRKQNSVLAAQVETLRNRVSILGSTNRQLRDENSIQSRKLRQIGQSNLVLEQKIESSTQLLSQRERELQKLRVSGRKTVVANERLQGRVESITSQHRRCAELLSSYQNAYADLYSGAVGASLSGITITSTTSIESLRRMIGGATNTSGIAAAPDYSYLDVGEDEEDGDEIVSL